MVIWKKGFAVLAVILWSMPVLKVRAIGAPSEELRRLQTDIHSDIQTFRQTTSAELLYGYDPNIFPPGGELFGILIDRHTFI